LSGSAHGPAFHGFVALATYSQCDEEFTNVPPVSRRLYASAIVLLIAVSAAMLAHLFSSFLVDDESIDDISSFLFALTTSYLAYRTMLSNEANHLDD
jgi:hypothetical protein